MGGYRVSTAMWKGNEIVLGLRQRLCCNLINTTKSVKDGQLQANTSNNKPTNLGFSMRVKRRDDKGGTVSIFAIKDGQYLKTPVREDLEGVLPGHQTEINAYVELLKRWGCGPEYWGDSSRRMPRLAEVGNLVVADLDELVRCALALANPPVSDSSAQ